jgi:hypothetical protein
MSETKFPSNERKYKGYTLQYDIQRDIWDVHDSAGKYVDWSDTLKGAKEIVDILTN